MPLPTLPLPAPRSPRHLLVPEVLPAERAAAEPAVIPFPLRLSADREPGLEYRAARVACRGLLIDVYG
jgi:hypothetical protein